MNASDARKIAIKGALEAIHELIEQNAQKGLNYLDMSRYEGIYTSPEVYDKLRKEGYNIDGDMIYW